jgi:hypothetical protein
MTNTPKFGDIVTNHLAGESNPGRVSFFVRAGRIPRGRMNAGPYWELTDGLDTFWKIRPSDTLTFYRYPLKAGTNELTELRTAVLELLDSEVASAPGDPALAWAAWPPEYGALAKRVGWRSSLPPKQPGSTKTAPFEVLRKTTDTTTTVESTEPGEVNSVQSVDRAELIRVGAQGITPAYGTATIKKATSVVDALLAHYDIRPK